MKTVKMEKRVSAKSKFKEIAVLTGTHQRLKEISAKEGIPMYELATMALNELIQKYQLKNS